MKRLLFAIIALLCITSCEMYEDDNSYYINAQEAARVVMDASNSGSYITDIAKMGDVYHIVFTSGHTIRIAELYNNGHNPYGTLTDIVKSVTVGSEQVDFEFFNGNTISIPLAAAIGISFDIDTESIAIAPNSVYTLGYRIDSYYRDISVDIVTSQGIKAVDKGGAIEIRTSNTISDNSELIIFIHNSKRVIKRCFKIVQAIPNNQIRYTTNDNKQLEFYNDYGLFAANIQSHKWDNLAHSFVITFDRDLTSIGDFAFADCHNITSITLPTGITSIGINPFYNCSNLAEFRGKFSSEDGRCLIANGTLCSFAPAGITEYRIPDDVVSIGNEAFSGSTNLTKIDIGNSVSYIGESAFSNCNKIKSITIPDSVTSIGDSAFYHCSGIKEFNGKFASEDKRCLIIDGVLHSFALGCGLEAYTVPLTASSIGSYAFSGCSSLTSVTTNDYLTTIGSYAFSGCSNLKSVTIGFYVSYIDKNPFKECDELSFIYCRALEPPKLSGNIFPQLETGFRISVPNFAFDKYRNESDWARYYNYIYSFNYTDLPFYTSTDYSYDGKSILLAEATSGKGIDIVIMGDGFSDRQIANGSYEQIMRSAYEKIFLVEPYKSFKNLFNVYYVNVVSPNEGCGIGVTTISCRFGEGTRIYGDNDLAIAYAQKVVGKPRIDQTNIIVILNSDHFAGHCYWYSRGQNDYGSGVAISYVSTDPTTETFAELIHHEACGHGFAKLADEYAYRANGDIPADEQVAKKNQYSNYGWWKNVDFTPDITKVHWAKFISDSRYQYEGLGAFEGGATYWTGVWRPTANSIMRYNRDGFNAPSREAIYYRIHKLAYGENWTYNYETFVSWDAINRKTSAEQASQEHCMVLRQYELTPPPTIIKGGWKEVSLRR